MIVESIECVVASAIRGRDGARLARCAELLDGSWLPSPFVFPFARWIRVESAHSRLLFYVKESREKHWGPNWVFLGISGKSALHGACKILVDGTMISAELNNL